MFLINSFCISSVDSGKGSFMHDCTIGSNCTMKIVCKCFAHAVLHFHNSPKIIIQRRHAKTIRKGTDNCAPMHSVSGCPSTTSHNVQSDDQNQNVPHRTLDNRSPRVLPIQRFGPFPCRTEKICGSEILAPDGSKSARDSSDSL